MSTFSLGVADEQQAVRPVAMALATRFLRALERRRTIQELDRLDDRMLSDIGLSRGDIGRAVSGVRY